MALEKECDLLLFEISEMFELKKDNDGSTIREGAKLEDILQRQNVKSNQVIKNNIGAIINILLVDEFIKIIIPADGVDRFRMDRNGIAFLAKEDSYVKRKERWDLEMQIKEQQSKLNIIELKLKPYTFGIAVLGLLISILAIFVSLYNRH